MAMSTPQYRIVVLGIVILAVAGALSWRARRTPPPPAETVPAATAAVPTSTPLPRLVDLGATKCIPCKMMAPILDELRREHAERLRVDFIDVWEHPEAADAYGVKIIPTQVFYDAEGRERFRHEGFFAKEDILAKWRELGVDLP